MSQSAYTLFCWNIGNPSPERAGTQAQWLQDLPVDLFVLTETKASAGCQFLERYFQTRGYHVAFPKPEANEYGVMFISRHPLTMDMSLTGPYLAARMLVVQTETCLGPVEITGLYVPSRDATLQKKHKKRLFLEQTLANLGRRRSLGKRIVCGDLNILEPDHVPRYPFFEAWEYDFYRNLAPLGLKDVFRHMRGQNALEYSWVGRTGDGYRYDHIFASQGILQDVEECYYLHGPRTQRLSDHSAIVIHIGKGAKHLSPYERDIQSRNKPGNSDGQLRLFD